MDAPELGYSPYSLLPPLLSNGSVLARGIVWKIIYACEISSPMRLTYQRTSLRQMSRNGAFDLSHKRRDARGSRPTMLRLEKKLSLQPPHEFFYERKYRSLNYKNALDGKTIYFDIEMISSRRTVLGSSDITSAAPEPNSKNFGAILAYHIGIGPSRSCFCPTLPLRAALCLHTRSFFQQVLYRLKSTSCKTIAKNLFARVRVF
jgi:hypothetical protein